MVYFVFMFRDILMTIIRMSIIRVCVFCRVGLFFLFVMVKRYSWSILVINIWGVDVVVVISGFKLSYRFLIVFLV